MLIGIPAEIKNREYRVGMTPESVHQAVAHGHQLLVQSGAGNGVGAGDDQYRQAGAQIAKTARDVFRRAEMIVKVKEPLAPERKMLRPGQLLFTYLHLAADKTLTRELVASGAVAVAYETVADSAGRLPLLAPMSKVAGRLAAQVAAVCLLKNLGGIGKLIGGVPGVEPAKVVIIGGGVVGRNSARIAVGMGADVFILEKRADVMDAIEAEFDGRARCVFSNASNLSRHVSEADAVIGAALVAGAAAPKLVTEAMVKSMRPGSVVVDVAIDQGGCVATAKPTTHDKPTYIKHGVVHYCVTNMPGAAPRTSAYALNNATLPFILELADKGWKRALRENPQLCAGLSAANGKLLCAESAKSLGMKRASAEAALA